MSGVAGISNLAAVNKTFETSISEFAADRPGVTWQQFTTLVQSDGTSTDFVVTDGVPRIRKHIGSLEHRNIRAHKLTVTNQPWEASIAIPLAELRGDRSGVLEQRVDELLGGMDSYLDDIVVSELLSNPTCYDGSALLANSHSFVGGSGTTDNLEAAALSFSLFNTAQEKLREMKNEEGAPLNCFGNLLLVGPQQEREAKEITGSDRPVAIGTLGDQDATSGVQSAVTLRNFMGGSTMVAVSHEITGNEWFLMDTTKGRRKPMYLVEFEAFQGIALTDPKDEPVYRYNELQYSVKGDYAPAAGDWHCIVGSVSA